MLEPELAASLAGRLDAGQLGELEGIVGRFPEPARSDKEERTGRLCVRGLAPSTPNALPA